MRRQLSEEQLDNLMRSLMNDSAADEAMVNDIADSPSLWRGIDRSINEGTEAGRSPWPPPLKFWRMLFVGVPVAAAILIVISIFVLRPSVVTVDQANISGGQAEVTTANSLVASPSGSQSEPVILSADVRNDTSTKKIFANLPIQKAVMRKAVRKPVTQIAKRTEIKTEFIALSYAGNPESGQIVRVKVPSSMMVSLGLMATVARPNSLVNAEVVVGDDGMSHAIRFIR